MSRKHPQNGPKFQPGHIRRKALADAELKERQVCEKAREVGIVADAEDSREFWKNIL